MKVTHIPDHEASFRADTTDSNGTPHNLAEKQVTIPGTNDPFTVVSCVPANGDQSFYYPEKTTKEKIVLHFTAGYIKGDIAALTTKDNHVSVAYVIARDGNIYQLFDPDYWSYHLGSGAIGGNTNNSKTSIGIELSNIGPLTQSGDAIKTVYGDTYCTTDQQEYYLKTDNFRGYTVFATHTDAQYEALAKLVRYLTARYNIPNVFLDEASRYEVNEKVAAHKGIVSHINFRTSGKWDIGPGFDWERLIKGTGATVANVATNTEGGASGSTTTYVVQSGDTLGSIASRLGVTVEALSATNEDKLKTWGNVKGFNAGETIVIPA